MSWCCLMKPKLMEILACPICKSENLELHVFEENEEIDSALIICSDCNRWYPVIDTIPYMLPDKLRDKKEELKFLAKWKKKVPSAILEKGKPYTL